MDREPESTHLWKEPCPACGSRDNLARYSDGHGYCFGCGHYEKGTQSMGESTGITSLPATEEGEQKEVLSFQGEIADLPKRGIREDTTRLWSYRIGTVSGKPAQIAYYLDAATRKPIAAKVRFPDKSFSWLGHPREVQLYGQWLWRDGGKMVVVTEGEIDALSVSQVQSNKWPVVSVPNGASGAAKSIRKSLDWLNKFDTVVFMFDMDEPGRAAALECAKLLPPGKAKIAHLPLKDANECLTAGRGSEIIDAIWGATVYRPDGIVSASDLWDRINADVDSSGVGYPYDTLTQKTGGIRKGELVTITAGSGIGKSLFCREIAHDLIINKGWKVGYIALEENVRRTLLGLMGLHIGKPLHISREGVTETEFQDAYLQLADKLFLYDSFGSIDPDNLMDRLRYMAVGLQCDALVLDHISIAISGLEEIDERRALDIMMTKIRSLVEETGVALFLVSHLKRPSQSDKGHEQGLQTSLAQLRGSHAIAQLSDIVIGLERNQQGDNPNETIVRVLKNRFNGDTGVTTCLHYSKDTGRLSETDFTEEDNNVPF
jgi:twinkle protein